MVERLPCSMRTFPLKLSSWLPASYASHLQWLRHLLERIGQVRALALWQQVCQDYDDELVQCILSTGWNTIDQPDEGEVEERISEICVRFFPVALDGVTMESARKLVELMPPIHQIRQIFPTLQVWKELTAYEALHLRFDGAASLTEVMTRTLGKQGELVAYDILKEERIKKAEGKMGSVAEFLSEFISEPKEASLFTAGLESQIISVSEKEVVLHVSECEWARYFRERHPQVGYLMACSTDEAAYRTFNEKLRMQRTSTLMEGGAVCDFRIFEVSDVK